MAQSRIKHKANLDNGVDDNLQPVFPLVYHLWRLHMKIAFDGAWIISLRIFITQVRFTRARGSVTGSKVDLHLFLLAQRNEQLHGGKDRQTIKRTKR